MILIQLTTEGIICGTYMRYIVTYTYERTILHRDLITIHIFHKHPWKIQHIKKNTIQEMYGDLQLDTFKPSPSLS